MAGKITRTEVIDCSCTPHREHGDPHCYNVHKCGCNACREGYRKYRKVMTYNKRQGKGKYSTPLRRGTTLPTCISEG